MPSPPDASLGRPDGSPEWPRGSFEWPRGSFEWTVSRHEVGAGAFHALEVPAAVGREVWISHPPTPALVLGSAQAGGVVDHTEASTRGIEVVRRRSGGGGVLVVPGDLCWIDVLIGRDDPLWHEDVGRAMHWVGEVWVAALADLGVVATVHRGPLVRTAWSDLICFAGLGPGEVVGDGGAKIVGISQRRTRNAARFQTAALLRWDPSALVALLAPPLPADQALLGPAARGIPSTARDLEAAFLRHLPAA